MKRGLLIAGGALGGLGAVMAITPPQFSSNESLAIGGGAMGGSTSTVVATATATDSPTPTATKTKGTATKKATASKAATPAATLSAPATQAATPQGVNGPFSGPSIFIAGSVPVLRNSSGNWAYIGNVNLSRGFQDEGMK